MLSLKLTVLESQDVHRNQRECSSDRDLDSPDRDADAPLASSPVQGSLVILQSRLDAQAQPLYVQGPEGLA